MTAGGAPSLWPARVVLLLCTSSRVGGTERNALELAVSLRERGVAVDVLCRDSGDGPLGALARDLDVPLLRADRRRTTLRRLRGSDVVVAFGLRWSLQLRLLRALRLVPESILTVTAQRGLDVWRTWRIDALDRATARYVDLFLANSTAAADVLTARVGVPQQRVETVRSGLDDEWFVPPPVPSRARPGCVRIAVVGTARPEKRHDLVVEVLARLPADGWAATVFTSDGSRVRAALVAAGLQDAVTVVQGHGVSPQDYDRHDVLLHVSDAESLPRAVLEALARGLSVVATDVGDTGALVHGRGRLVLPGDLDALAEAARAAVEEVAAGRLREPLLAQDWGRGAVAEDFLARARARRAVVAA